MAPLFDTNNTVKRNLPYNAGSYNAPAGPQYSPAGGIGTVDGDYTFQEGNQWLKTPPVEIPEAPPQQEVDLYAKYRDPKTGDVMTPEEYSTYLGGKVPQSASGDIGQYAGDALSSPDESAGSLRGRARELNNFRNDIATGTTDPYEIGAKSGIAYSPQELAAIESAYAGIYDPAINDVFERLKTREDEAKRVADREDRVFATNESIRQWQATTGTKAKSDSEKVFTQSQLNSGASSAGLSLEAFSSLDSDIKNFYINTPSEVDSVSGKSYKMTVTFDNLISQVETGELTAQEATDEIMSSNLPDTVKHYYINLLPLSVEEKEGYWKKLWGAVTGN